MVRSCHNCEVRFAIGGADKLTSLVASVMFVVVGVSASTCLPPYLSKGKKYESTSAYGEDRRLCNFGDFKNKPLASWAM